MAHSEVIPAPDHGPTPPLDALLAASQSALSLDELLPALTTCWRDHALAGVAVIGVAVPDCHRIAACRAEQSGATRLNVSPGFDGSPADEGLRQRLIDAAAAGDPASWIPVADCGSVIGGILLYTDRGRALFPVPPVWVTATAHLLARARLYEQRLRDDKLEALAEFSAGAGHEINNPLGSIVMSVGTLLKDEQDPERRRLLSKIGGEAYRARDMISDAMTFARPPQSEPADLDLAEQIEDVLSRFAEPIEQHGIVVVRQLSRPTPIHADRTQLAVVISELLRNALKAVEDGGQLQIECRSEDGTGEALLTLTDDGCGLNEEQRLHLFDPFYSGRQAGRGLGFGLPKAWRIITNHGGRISVTGNDPRGLTFAIRWPARPALR